MAEVTAHIVDPSTQEMLYIRDYNGCRGIILMTPEDALREFFLCICGKEMVLSEEDKKRAWAIIRDRM